MQKIYRTSLIILSSLAGLSGCGESTRLVGEGHDSSAGDAPPTTASVATILLENPSNFERIDEATVLKFDALGMTPGTSYRVNSDGEELPSQAADTNGDGTVDSLIFLSDFSAEQKRTVEIVEGEAAMPVKRTQAEVSIKRGGEWEGQVYKGGTFVNVDSVDPPPQYTDHSEFIRYEGPGIESDKVGYRVYLDWRNGFDIFGKTTTDLVLQDIGLDGYDSYHEPGDWGLDILKVGNAVGIGGYGYWDGEKIIRVSKTRGRSTRVVNDGPLTSTLKIFYDDWQVAGRTTDLRALLTMTAGSRLVHTRLETSPDLPNVAIGIVKHPDAEVIHGDLEIAGHAWTYVATWGPQALADGDLGMVLLFRKNARMKQSEDEHNIVSVMQPGDGRLEYYFGAAWSQEPDGLTTRGAFTAWLEKEAERLTMPLRSRIRTVKSAAETSAAIDAAANQQ